MLKPGGRLLITDYCLGSTSASENFKSYIDGRKYELKSIHVRHDGTFTTCCNSDLCTVFKYLIMNNSHSMHLYHSFDAFFKAFNVMNIIHFIE